MREEQDAKEAWEGFLREVSRARELVHCSRSAVWFRGHANRDWSLVPSILRIRNHLDADRRKKLKEFASKAASANGTRNSEVLRAVRYGERDAFQAWRLRPGTDRNSSWQTLAEMQHFRVPTRLLDWTTSFGVAVFFAIEPILGRVAARSDLADVEHLLAYSAGLPNACVWILNPYSLARKAGGGNVVSDITLEPDLDYFQSFFHNYNWPFDLPVPAIVPWNNLRIEAQRGLFTIHGTSTLGLEVSCGQKNDICRRVELPPLAGAYGAMQISQLMGLDQYAIYRDYDSLGPRIRQEFMSPHPRVLILTERREDFDGLELNRHLRVTVCDRFLDIQGQVGAESVARRATEDGDPFDVVVCDERLSYPLKERLNARANFLAAQQLVVAPPFSRFSLTQEIRKLCAT